MNSRDFVPSELRTKASESLEKEVANELAQPDPPKNVATASIEKAIETDDSDGQEGKGGSNRFRNW